MASTRHAPAMEIYGAHDAYLSSNSNGNVESALLNAFGPVSNASNQDVQLMPTTTVAPGSSPQKTDSSPLRPISSHSLTDIKIPLPPQPSFNTDSPQKNGNFYSTYPLPVQQMPQGTLFSHFCGKPSYDQQSHYDNAIGFEGLPILAYAEANYAYGPPIKRDFTDMEGSTRDRSNKKQKTSQCEPIELPDPTQMPPVHDDGSKPSHSYAELIGMAILRSSERRLTLAQIYKWISDHFKFYNPADSGWQNSIRHNLSLNKNFIKIERPKDNPGKGNYWAIKPGEERPYLLGKKNPVRRMTNPDGSHYHPMLPHSMMYQTGNEPAIGHFSLAPTHVKRIETKVIDSAKFPDEAELSSDGTIPGSDPALQEDEVDEAATMMPPPLHVTSSPPPADIGSSPPQLVEPARKDTSPIDPGYSSISRSRNGRQKFTGLHDSGFWSSIESSAARGATQLLTSDADVPRPRIRKGRAEAEIARIRSSSVGSPSQERRDFGEINTSFGSSSPVREHHPLTPAVVFQRPTKPPPSVSPNTNLRDHRNRMRALLGTPAKSFSPAPETSSWSPAFNFGEDGSVGLTPYISPYKSSRTPWKPNHDTPGAHQLYNSSFDVFIDAPEEDLTARGSPEKRSAKRPSLARAATSAGILAEVTGSARSNSITLAPPAHAPFSLSPTYNHANPKRPVTQLGSPLKQCYRPSASPDWTKYGVDVDAENVQPFHNGKNDAAELFGVNLASDGSEEAIDIFQDFGKIGQTQQMMPATSRANGSPPKRFMAPPARPQLGRSNTSRW